MEDPINFECVDTGAPPVVVSNKVLERRAVMRNTINKLRDESADLRREVNELKEQVDVLQHQNNKILKLIRDQQQCLSGVFRVETQESCEYMDRFPIKNQQELDAVENEINDDTRAGFINTVRSLLTPGGITKRLSNVLSTDICLEYNLNGIISKKRLRDYSKLMDVIFRATMKEGWTQKLFHLEVRQSMKLIKNKHYKNLCLMRKSIREAVGIDSATENTPKPRKPFTPKFETC